MKFEALKRRVERAERLVDGRIVETIAHGGRFRLEWKQIWTPGRILVAGLLSGFLVGRRRSGGDVAASIASGGRWLKLLPTLTGLFSSLQAGMAAVVAASEAGQAGQQADIATEAADAASQAQHDAEEAAADAAGGDTPRPAPDRRRPEPTLEQEPQAAAAATEISER